MGLFDKAAKAGAKKTVSKKSETVWLVSGEEGVAVKELITLAQEAKAIEAKSGVFKNRLKSYGETKFVEDYARLGVAPESPTLIQNEDGQRVTFVIQDRSSQYAVKDEQYEELVDFLGQDAADGMLYEEVSFGFNRDVLALPGVRPVIEKALEGAIRKLQNDGCLSETQSEALLDVDVKRAFKPGTLDRLVLLAGRDTTRLGRLLGILGSAATRYVKT